MPGYKHLAPDGAGGQPFPWKHRRTRFWDPPASRFLCKKLFPTVSCEKSGPKSPIQPPFALSKGLDDVDRPLSGHGLAVASAWMRHGLPPPPLRVP